MDAEAKNREEQVSALAENTSEKIRELNAQRDDLIQEISHLKCQKDGLETVINLDREKERLEAINDNLRDTERKLREKGDEAVTALQERPHKNPCKRQTLTA